MGQPQRERASLWERKETSEPLQPLEVSHAASEQQSCADRQPEAQASGWVAKSLPSSSAINSQHTSSSFPCRLTKSGFPVGKKNRGDFTYALWLSSQDRGSECNTALGHGVRGEGRESPCFSRNYLLSATFPAQTELFTSTSHSHSLWPRQGLLKWDLLKTSCCKINPLN